MNYGCTPWASYYVQVELIIINYLIFLSINILYKSMFRFISSFILVDLLYMFYTLQKSSLYFYHASCCCRNETPMHFRKTWTPLMDHVQIQNLTLKINGKWTHLCSLLKILYPHIIWVFIEFRIKCIYAFSCLWI